MVLRGLQAIIEKTLKKLNVSISYVENGNNNLLKNFSLDKWKYL